MAVHRIGIVGIENSHVDGILRALDVDGVANARVTCLVAGEAERTAQLADLGGIASQEMCDAGSVTSGA